MGWKGNTYFRRCSGIFFLPPIFLIWDLPRDKLAPMCNSEGFFLIVLGTWWLTLFVFSLAFVSCLFSRLPLCGKETKCFSTRLTWQTFFFVVTSCLSPGSFPSKNMSWLSWLNWLILTLSFEKVILLMMRGIYFLPCNAWLTDCLTDLMYVSLWDCDTTHKDFCFVVVVVVLLVCLVMPLTCSSRISRIVWLGNTRLWVVTCECYLVVLGAGLQALGKVSWHWQTDHLCTPTKLEKSERVAKIYLRIYTSGGSSF